MPAYYKDIAPCNICKDEYTSSFIEVMPGNRLYVCQHCVEASRFNFIWICLNCGHAYLRPKTTVMNRRNGYGIREAVVLREMKIIQGIYFCIKCNPIGILEQKMKKADQLNQENH
jgi:DNA-directed RNA polymerase subunit RPC12/RpoP